jgi:hypothetical protein
MLGTPVPVTLGGKEYSLRPLTYGDIEELDNWVRAQYMERVIGSLPKDTSPDDREVAWRIAQATVVELTWLSGLGAKFIATPKGFMKIASLTVQDLGEKELTEILMNDKSAMKRMTDALRLSTGESKGDGKPGKSTSEPSQSPS